jgi:hypothetical protein
LCHYSEALLLPLVGPIRNLAKQATVTINAVLATHPEINLRSDFGIWRFRIKNRPPRNRNCPLVK